MRDKPAPSKERQELIDKGHIEADPSREGLHPDDIEKQDAFRTKLQQSWRRTMDDLRGRTADLKERARDDDRSGR